ncbi:MAG TPA: DNA adenine methylase [Kiritimatiellia bacterium]|nr:DNA adenine methylase [Kiritimatiellia bacterium]
MKSPLAYMGGKSRLTGTLVPVIESIPHACYCEPFCGACWVLFAKPEECSKCEVINDLDGELIRFWRCVQRHYIPLLDLFRHAIVSREMFDWLKIERPETLTDLQRAARYYYLQRMSFGGKVTGRTFGYSATERPRLDLSGMADDLLSVNRRLARVTVEHLDGLDCIRRYDRPATLFFVDPPYMDVTGYAVPFPSERYAELSDALRSIKGTFLLTLNDHPEVRRIFSHFMIHQIATRYSVAGSSKQKRVSELLITNKKGLAIT